MNWVASAALGDTSFLGASSARAAHTIDSVQQLCLKHRVMNLDEDMRI